MNNIYPLEDPGNYKWAIKRIRHLWNEGIVIWTHHAEERMDERDCNMLDVQHIIRYGQIIEHSLPKGYWRYTIKGETLSGRTASCVVEVKGSLIIVTVIA